MRRVLLGLFSMVMMSLVPTTAVAAPVMVREPLSRLANGHTTAQSTNWSGYADTGSTFTDVKGSWTEPSVTCASRSTSYSSFWVGLDGFNSNSVEQLGTDSDCSRGRPVYYAWYEMYPAYPVNLSQTVAPGDSMSAEVLVSGTTFTLTISNNTRGWTASTTQSSSSAARTSAEWVAEAPSSCGRFGCTVLPLANFGTMNFTGAATTLNGTTGKISSFTNNEIVMVTNGGAVKAQPTALNATGDGFSDTWKHS
jgi:hypothetical protein